MRAQGPDNGGRRKEHCEHVFWREHDRRCELWMVNGHACLRLFEGDTLLIEEPVLEGALLAQALALRTWRPGRRQRHLFGFRERP
jgi:hypothetical protein